MGVFITAHWRPCERPADDFKGEADKQRGKKDIETRNICNIYYIQRAVEVVDQGTAFECERERHSVCNH